MQKAVSAGVLSKAIFTDFEVGNNSEENIWVLVSASGVIMDVTSSQLINLDRGADEVYYVYNVAYSSTIQNLVAGNLFADLDGCSSNRS